MDSSEKTLIIRPESFRFKDLIDWSKRIEEMYHANSNHNRTGMAVLISGRNTLSQEILPEKKILHNNKKVSVMGR